MPQAPRTDNTNESPVDNTEKSSLKSAFLQPVFEVEQANEQIQHIYTTELHFKSNGVFPDANQIHTRDIVQIPTVNNLESTRNIPPVIGSEFSNAYIQDTPNLSANILDSSIDLSRQQNSLPDGSPCIQIQAGDYTSISIGDTVTDGSASRLSRISESSELPEDRNSESLSTHAPESHKLYSTRISDESVCSKQDENAHSLSNSREIETKDESSLRQSYALDHSVGDKLENLHFSLTSLDSSVRNLYNDGNEVKHVHDHYNGDTNLTMQSPKYSQEKFLASQNDHLITNKTHLVGNSVLSKMLDIVPSEEKTTLISNYLQLAQKYAHDLEPNVSSLRNARMLLDDSERGFSLNDILPPKNTDSSKNETKDPPLDISGIESMEDDIWAKLIASRNELSAIKMDTEYFIDQISLQDIHAFKMKDIVLSLEAELKAASTIILDFSAVESKELETAENLIEGIIGLIKDSTGGC